MCKEILTFGDIELKKINFTAIKVEFFLKNINIVKVLVSSKIFSGEKSVSTSLVTCVMILKLNHYI